MNNKKQTIMNYKFAMLLFVVASITFTSCKKDIDEVVIPNEEELITTVNYTLVPVGGGTTVTLTYKDLDGDGSGAPVITNGMLVANTAYNATIQVLNEQETPAEDITVEVQDEALEHQFFFQASTTNMSVAYDDMDADGNPIGIKSVLTTTAAGTGNLTIILRHEPAKTATGVAGGDITNAGGETDIEVTFEVDVQ